MKLREPMSGLDEDADHAQRAFEMIVKDYEDCPRLMADNGRTLGQEAEQELYALRHLRVGKPAPEIEGVDLDGKPFKLSDSRGKVRALVFWATWCGPCMQMVPHERELVERMNDRPFMLIGINGDEDRATAKKVTIKEKMSWRSFWNGPEGPSGAISRQWNVRGWPTVYILDHEGIIRARDVFDKALDQTVQQLVDAIGHER